VTIPDVSRMPRQARSLQAQLRHSFVKSSVSIPLSHDGELTGCYGFDYLQEPVSWTTSEVAALAAPAEFLAGLLSRRTVIPAPPLPETISTVYLGTGSCLVAAPADQIVVIEACGDYSRIRLASGAVHLHLRSLKSWAEQHSPKLQQIHRRYLINWNRIRELKRSGDGWTVSVNGCAESYSVGRAFHLAVRQRFGF
jgi:DNA-binding LytR/AlgR family response regulator